MRVRLDFSTHARNPSITPFLWRATNFRAITISCKWRDLPLGRRPGNHPGLSDLGLFIFPLHRINPATMKYSNKCGKRNVKTTVDASRFTMRASSVAVARKFRKYSASRIVRRKSDAAFSDLKQNKSSRHGVPRGHGRSEIRRTDGRLVRAALCA